MPEGRKTAKLAIDAVEMDLETNNGHLRYAHLGEAALRRVFLDIVRGTDFLQDVLTTVRTLELPEWRLVSGALYNTVWNHLTYRPPMSGIKDIDISYFDPDTSWQAEDRAIRRGHAVFSGPLPVEIRNQARVHLWYEDHFGIPIAPLRSVEQAIDNYASRTHAVGVRLESDGRLDLYAPFEVADIFAFRITPNTVRDNRETHERKGRRALRHWPELSIEPWPAQVSSS